MLLDPATRRNLELTETMRGQDKRGSLLWVLDKTKTAMGARMLRFFIEQPLLDQTLIEARLSAVEELKNEPLFLAELRELLEPIYDLERLMAKLIAKTANPRDLLAFKSSLTMLPHIKNLLAAAKCEALTALWQEIDVLADLQQKIEAGIAEDAPISSKEGGVIKPGYHEKVDQYRLASTQGKPGCWN